jgi:molybdopterin-guanine dinucleotide biosynthesis protein A
MEKSNNLDISCIALAGGKSTRLGRNKLAEMIGRQTLFDRVLSSLAAFNAEIIVVASKDISLPSLVNHPKVKTVNDIYPGTGSLGAIYTGLSTSTTHLNLVVACDMPFLNTGLLRYMVSISSGYDLVAYNKDDRPEPLHALYSKNCLAPMKSLIEQNKLRIIGILPFIRARYLEPAEIERFDPGYLSFFNINTPEDLQRARDLLASKK